VTDSRGVGNCCHLKLLLLNDRNKLESLQEGGSWWTRREIPQTACCKSKAYNCCHYH